METLMAFLLGFAGMYVGGILFVEVPQTVYFDVEYQQREKSFQQGYTAYYLQREKAWNPYPLAKKIQRVGWWQGYNYARRSFSHKEFHKES